mgnify:CR=1 FL=1
MPIIPTPLNGTYEIEMDKKGDERGFFARLFCSREWKLAGLDSTIAQINNSFSSETGTLRGLHYQLPPTTETKIVRCIQGSLWDVCLDLRKESPTYLQWHAALLSAQNRKMLYIPKGCAHGFITLEPNTEILYLVSAFYSPEDEGAVRFDDPAFNITWPIEPTVMSDRDRNLPNFQVEKDGILV